MKATEIPRDDRAFWSSGFLYCARCNWHSKSTNALRDWRWHMIKKHRK